MRADGVPQEPLTGVVIAAGMNCGCWGACGFVGVWFGLVGRGIVVSRVRAVVVDGAGAEADINGVDGDPQAEGVIVAGTEPRTGKGSRLSAFFFLDCCLFFFPVENSSGAV